MTLFMIAFIAGVLTVLAPCILPLLPIILGGSLHGGTQRHWAPYVVVASLVVSVVLFTLLLRASTIFIAIPDTFWAMLSGGLLIVLGYFMMFPDVWERIHARLPQGRHTAHRALAQGTQKNSFGGDMLVGAALGPVFSSCSPTYLVILGVVLPESFATGFVYLLAYASGLASVLLLVALLGQRIMKRFVMLANPHGWFKKTFGVIFVLVGIVVFTGTDKVWETALLQGGVYDNIGGLEQYLLDTAGL